VSFDAHRNRPRVDSTHSFYMELRGVVSQTTRRPSSSPRGHSSIPEDPRLDSAIDEVKYAAITLHDSSIRVPRSQRNLRALVVAASTPQ